MDANPIIIEQFFNLSIDLVWNAITDPREMKNWFFPQIESFVPEEGFETSFNIHVNGRDFNHLWKLTEVISDKKIVYDWRYEGYVGEAKVTFELVEMSEGTLLTLTHIGTETFDQDIPEFKRESGVVGWTYFIQKSLKEYLEGN